MELKAIVIMGILYFPINGFAQSRDTATLKRDSVNIPKSAVAYAADKFAIARPFNVEFSHTSPYNYSSERQGKAFPDSRVTNFIQVKASANINFIKKKNWLLGATMAYRFTTAAADISMPGTNGIKAVNNSYHYHFSTLNFSYFTKLLNKRTIFSSSILVDGSDKHFERVKAIFTGTMVLKANERTKMAVGILVNIDPSAQSPFIPTFSYEHKFNNGLVADITLPRSLYIRKYIFSNARVSLGAELDRIGFYLYGIDGTSQRYEYRQLDINSGINYEQVVARHFVLTAKTGVKLTLSGRIFRKEDSFADPVFQTSPDPAFYFSVGVSFNPFALFGKK